MAELTCLSSVETNLTLTCPSPKSFVCNLPDSGRYVTSVFQGLSLSRSVGRVGENPGKFMSRRLSRPLHPKYFLVCAKHNIFSSDYHWSVHLWQLHFQLFFFVCLFDLFSLVVVFVSLDKALWPVPEKCTGSEGLRRFAPCEGCSQGVVLGRNWFNRSPYYISKRQQISSVP